MRDRSTISVPVPLLCHGANPQRSATPAPAAVHERVKRIHGPSCQVNASRPCSSARGPGRPSRSLNDSELRVHSASFGNDRTVSHDPGRLGRESNQTRGPRVFIGDKHTTSIHGENTMRLVRTRTALAAIIAPTLLLMGPAPAQAAVTAVRDGNDTTIGADIHRVRVTHGGDLKVRVKLDRLRRTDRPVIQGMNVYVDLRRRHRGPEVMVEAGLWRRAAHVTTKAHHWARHGLLDCESTLRVSTRRDLAVLRLDGSCLRGEHPRARVAVTTYERKQSDARYEVDWLTGRRTFTPWVARG